MIVVSKKTQYKLANEAAYISSLPNGNLKNLLQCYHDIRCGMKHIGEAFKLHPNPQFESNRHDCVETAAFHALLQVNPFDFGMQVCIARHARDIINGKSKLSIIEFRTWPHTLPATLRNLVLGRSRDEVTGLFTEHDIVGYLTSRPTPVPIELYDKI